MKRSIALSLTEGRVIRDLFHNGMLEMLCEGGYDVLVITPAARVPQFVEAWSKTGIRIVNLPPYKLSAYDKRLWKYRSRVMRLGNKIFHLWMDFERRLWRPDPNLVSLLQENHSCLSVITQPMFLPEMAVYMAAKALELPTLGVIRSWDNLYRGLNIRPDKLAVWNPVNRQEAIDLLMYPPQQVVALGGVQFDPYFAAEAAWGREQFAQTLDLDPSRPIITLATTGSLLHMYDENYLVDLLLKAIAEGRIHGRPQLILRLHPASKLEYFSAYRNLPDVRISYIDGYVPTLGWTMRREDVIFVANMLRHSDVVVSPGSTITIETAIFDTPTVVPVFHTYQPELGKELYDMVFSRHFKRLAALDLVPFVHDLDSLIDAINHCLLDRGWYREQRARLVRDYIYQTDGLSTRRLADMVLRMAGE